MGFLGFGGFLFNTIKTLIENFACEESIFFKDFIYLFMRDTHREVETQAEGEAGFLHRAQCRTPSQNSGITP